jgi:hypothetical protein
MGEKRTRPLRSTCIVSVVCFTRHGCLLLVSLVCNTKVDLGERLEIPCFPLVGTAGPATTHPLHTSIQVDLDVANDHQVLPCQGNFFVVVCNLLLVSADFMYGDQITCQRRESQIPSHDLSTFRKLHGLYGAICAPSTASDICDPPPVNRELQPPVIIAMS